MGKKKYLTKERELELGTIIQSSKKYLEKNAKLKETNNSEYVRIEKEQKKAIDELVSNNVNLVHKKAHQFKARFPFAPNIEDIVQEGMIGLMNAVYKYDPTRGNKFSTVAHYWIFQSITRGINNTGRLVRLSENRIADYRKVIEIEKEFEESDLHQAEIDEIIMDRLGLNKKILMSIRAAAGSHSSLDKTIGSSEDNSKTLMEVINPDEYIQTDNEALHKECMGELYTLIEGLPEINREILKAHFDLSEGDRKTPKSIREEQNVSASRYRRLLTESLEKLKGDLSSRDFVLQDFLD